MTLLIGKKLGMTQLFEETGDLTPVSVIQAGPCPIVQVKTAETDGYAAIQIGYDEVKAQRLAKPLAGHFKNAKVKPLRVLTEVRVEDPTQFKVGDAVDVNAFEPNDIVHVVGQSKGKGFAGTIKRHRHHRGPETHGSHSHREPGSIGMCATPSRVFKGKKMPGRLGGKRTTVRNLRVVGVDAENNLLFVRGAIPGANNGIVYVRKD